MPPKRRKVQPPRRLGFEEEPERTSKKTKTTRSIEEATRPDSVNNLQTLMQGILTTMESLKEELGRRRTTNDDDEGSTQASTSRATTARRQEVPQVTPSSACSPAGGSQTTTAHNTQRTGEVSEPEEGVLAYSDGEIEFLNQATKDASAEITGILKQKGHRDAPPSQEELEAENVPKTEEEKPADKQEENDSPKTEPGETSGKKSMLTKGRSREGDTGEDNGNSSKVRFTENGVAVEKKEAKSGSKGSKGNSKVLRRKNTPARLPKMQRMQAKNRPPPDGALDEEAEEGSEVKETGSPEVKDMESPGLGSPEVKNIESPGLGSPEVKDMESPGMASPEVKDTEGDIEEEPDQSNITEGTGSQSEVNNEIQEVSISEPEVKGQDVITEENSDEVAEMDIALETDIDKAEIGDNS